MDMEQPRGSRRIRARRIGPAGDAVFRIEDADGGVLQRVRGARTPEQALAFYWRRLGAAIPGVAMGKDLERLIGAARAGRAGMQTPELPFDAEAAPVATELPQPKRRGRPPRTPEIVPQPDLFSEAVPAPSATPSVPEPEPQPQPAPSAPEPEPYALDRQSIGLQRVDAANLRPTDRADSYLYHVTNGSDATAALRSGLLVSPSDPMILTERQGVAYWLSVLADDYDYILDGPADFVVLRMRRLAVQDLLEADTHASRSAGCPCYLLTGGTGMRGGG